MEITKILTLSTGHIRPETARRLQQAVGYEMYDMPPVFEKGEYGYFIFVDEEYLNPDCDGVPEMMYPGIPRDLHECLSLAWVKGCRWLCLDRDCAEIKELPTYTWPGEGNSF